MLGCFLETFWRWLSISLSLFLLTKIIPSFLLLNMSTQGYSSKSYSLANCCFNFFSSKWVISLSYQSPTLTYGSLSFCYQKIFQPGCLEAIALASSYSLEFSWMWKTAFLSCSFLSSFVSLLPISCFIQPIMLLASRSPRYSRGRSKPSRNRRSVGKLETRYLSMNSWCMVRSSFPKNTYPLNFLSSSFIFGKSCWQCGHVGEYKLTKAYLLFWIWVSKLSGVS